MSEEQRLYPNTPALSIPDASAKPPKQIHHQFGVNGRAAHSDSANVGASFSASQRAPREPAHPSRTGYKARRTAPKPGAMYEKLPARSKNNHSQGHELP